MEETEPRRARAASFCGRLIDAHSRSGAGNLGDCAARLYLAVCLNYGRLDLIERLLARKSYPLDENLKRLIAAQSRRLKIQTKLVHILQLAIRPILRGTTLHVIR